MKLPRLTAQTAFADKSGLASGLFTRFWNSVCEAIEGAVQIDGSTGPITLPSYTVALLPTGTAAQIAYATDGRKNGEGAGLGTGVVVFKDATAWRACDTGATVAA